MKAIFTQRSPQGLIGNNLMVDHLHPDPNGCYLMATSFYEAVRAVVLRKNPEPNFCAGTDALFRDGLGLGHGVAQNF